MRGRQATGFHLELLQGVRKRKRQAQIVIAIGVQRAVKRIGDATRETAGHSDVRLVLHAPGRRHGRLDSRACQRDQFGHIPSIQGQFENPLRFHKLAHTHAPRFNERCVGLHLHSFRNLPDFERDIDHRIRVDLQHNPGPGECSKSRQ